MGFFSWKTSDTQENIMNASSGAHKTVYLLQPDGEPPIREDEYEGYGVFGGVDANIWLAQRNFPDETDRLSTDDLRYIGVCLDVGDILQHKDGTLISVFHGVPKPIFDVLSKSHKIIVFNDSYNAVIPEYGVSANMLIKSGDARPLQYSDILDIKYPLKFSFDEKAVYEALPAAKNSDNQGYFASDEPTPKGRKRQVA